MLTLSDKPEGITLTTNATDSTVIQGDTVAFTCGVAAAQPKVSLYQFYLNNSLVSNGSAGEYTIANVNRSQHHGGYKCVPHNDAGDGLEATVLLNINVPVRFTVPPQNFSTNVSDPILLRCDALGFPTPDISWKKSGKSVSDNKQLTILNSTKNDAGQYECTASNGVGKAKTAQAYVTIQCESASDLWLREPKLTDLITQIFVISTDLIYTIYYTNFCCTYLIRTML